MTPWEVLELPDGTDDRTEIRRAYATMVRRHPPESDPTGFRRVRDAYEVLRALSQRAQAPAVPTEAPARDVTRPVEPTENGRTDLGAAASIDARTAALESLPPPPPPPRPPEPGTTRPRATPSSWDVAAREVHAAFERPAGV